MPTASGHTSAIRASKVKGTNVYSTTGDKIGHVEDIILDKQSDRILFAALGFCGLLGMGEKYAPVPWSILDYNEDKNGYVIPMSEEEIKNAPAYDLSDLVKNDADLGQIRNRSFDYYKVPAISTKTVHFTKRPGIRRAFFMKRAIRVVRGV